MSAEKTEDKVFTYCCNVEIGIYESAINPENKYYYCPYCRKDLSPDGKSEVNWRHVWTPYQDFEKTEHAFKRLLSFYSQPRYQGMSYRESLEAERSAFRFGVCYAMANLETLTKDTTDNTLIPLSEKFFPMPERKV